jgi:hypothetical protein
VVNLPIRLAGAGYFDLRLDFHGFADFGNAPKLLDNPP